MSFFFLGREIAEKLGYANTNDALARHVDTDDKADVVFHDGRQRRNMVSINESGLYSLYPFFQAATGKKSLNVGLQRCASEHS